MAHAVAGSFSSSWARLCKDRIRAQYEEADRRRIQAEIAAVAVDPADAETYKGGY